MYTVKSSKQIFSKIASSSNRRLDNQAMVILFDLMLMGLKYQVSQIVQAEEILFFTNKHIKVMKELVADSQAIPFLSVCEEKLQQSASQFTCYDYMILR